MCLRGSLNYFMEPTLFFSSQLSASHGPTPRSCEPSDRFSDELAHSPSLSKNCLLLVVERNADRESKSARRPPIRRGRGWRRHRAGRR